MPRMIGALVRTIKGRSGLRNKRRKGRSGYSVFGKALEADRYGSWSNGRLITSERINGRNIGKQLPAISGDYPETDFCEVTAEGFSL